MASSSRARPSPNFRSSPNVTQTRTFGFIYRWGPRNGPHTPHRSGRPGGAVAPLDYRAAWGPEMAPIPPIARDAPTEPWRPSITARPRAPKWPPYSSCTPRLFFRDRQRDSLRRHRKLGQPHAGRVLDGVGNRRGRRHDRRLADAARAERAGRRWLLHDDALD